MLQLETSTDEICTGMNRSHNEGCRMSERIL